MASVAAPLKEEVAIVELSEGDKEAIVAAVLKSQRDGYVAHDLAGYIGIWDHDARLVSGRRATAGPYDFSLNLEEIEVSRALEFVGSPTMLHIEASDIELSGNTDEALLIWKLTKRADSFSAVFGEHYKLRLSGGNWKVFENRFWLLSSGPTEMLEEVDFSEYEALDAEASLTSGMERIQALLGSGRLPEGYEELKKMKPSGNDTSKNQFEYWKMRSTVAQLVGAGADAKTSACKARALNPDAKLKAWKLAIDCS